MLDDVKECIRSLPDYDFGIFYQQYVSSVQDDIIESDIADTYKKYNKIEDSNSILNGLNQLTEELKKL